MSARALAVAARPAQWLKNVPVLAPAVFGHRLHDVAAVRAVLGCALAFCAMASAGYLVNDVVDRRADAAHPRRRTRPVASGALPPRTALAAAAVLAAAALALAAAASTRLAVLGLGLYAVATLAYTGFAKRRGLLGPVVVAGGFVLRVLAGAWAASVAPSPWLLALTGALALALAVAKREAERRRVGGEAPTSFVRATDALLAVAAVGYAAYTVAPGTVALHGTRALGWTALPVALALARFRARLRADRTGAGPAELVAGDPILLGLGVVWGAACVVVLGAGPA